jgi:hypothetical protein
MKTIGTFGAAALIAAAFAGLAPARANAGAVENFTMTGASVSGNFSTTQPIPCGTTTSTLFTFISFNAFEGGIRDHGTLTPTVNTGYFVQQNDNCTGDVFQDFGFTETGGAIQVKNSQSATISGTFPLAVSGGTLTLNLTLGSPNSTSQGASITRNNFGVVMFMERSTGVSTDAGSISGTVALNGQNIPLTAPLGDFGAGFSKQRQGTLMVVAGKTH